MLMKKILFSLLAMLLITSCKKKESDPITGEISGNVKQYDQYGEQLSAGRSGVVVTINNSNVTATTDESGNYTLKKVPQGVYTIYFNKPSHIKM